MTIRTPSQDPALLLKSAPPRALRGFLARERLEWSRLERSDTQVTALLAPSGFGKSTQLAHWRREALARGTLAFWHTADARDEPLRWVRGLALSAHQASGKRGFADPVMRWIDERSDPQEAMTGWLAEVAELAQEVILLLDDVDQLPAATSCQVLSYLLGNAPANLRVALAARPTATLVTSGALGTAPVLRIHASDLRFTINETLAVASAAIGTRCNPEAGVRLHELTEGWPLGVQLAAAALHRGGDLTALLADVTADIRRHFVDTAIDRQPAPMRDLLVRLAHFDLIHPDMCKAVFGGEGVARELTRLQEETPLLLQAEDGEWMRLHPLAREVLRERLARLPVAERQAISRGAAAWLVAHDFKEEAAEHCFLAGDVEQAIELVEGRTHQMTETGNTAAVLAWYQRLSAEEIRQHPGFWAPAAWALVMSERHAEAQPLIELILAQPGLPETARFEAGLITMTETGFADRIDLMSAALARWPEPPRDVPPGQLVIFWLSCGVEKFYLGQPDIARQFWSRIAALDSTEAYSPATYGYAAISTGMSHLWEGRYALASQVLRPALARAESQLQRQHPVSCGLAALLAQAAWECGDSEEPRALLARRVEVLDRHGLPEALIAAYRTLARIADEDGRQDQALTLLEALRAVGETRAMPRLQVAAHYEIVRLHARRGRTASALAQCAQLDALVNTRPTHFPEPMVRWLELHAALAHAHAEVAQDGDRRLAAARAALESAAALAMGLRRQADLVEARLLHALVLARQGDSEADRATQEALSLAEANGMLRLVREIHPQAAGRVSQVAPAPHRTPPTPAMPRESAHAGLLTLKEREVLVLMGRNLSNKEIALAMGIGEQTIKWHVKNLFDKLDAASRKHAVARARLQGLISQ